MNTWEVNEKLTTAFVKFGIDTELGSLPLRGNIGVQAITGRSDFGICIITNASDPGGYGHCSDTVVTEGDKYTDVLPSLNLALEFPHDMKLRFGAAVTVARPRLDELGGGASYTSPPNRGPESSTGSRTTGSAMAAATRSSGRGRRIPSTCRSRNTSATGRMSRQRPTTRTSRPTSVNHSTIEEFRGRAAAGSSTRTIRLTYNEADANRIGRVDAQVERLRWLYAGIRTHGLHSLLTVLGGRWMASASSSAQPRTAPRSRSTA